MTAERTVTRSEFLRDPAATYARAEREGPVTIVDDNGKPLMEIHCPRDTRPVSHD